MVEYHCDLCNYVTIRLSSHRKHQNTKKHQERATFEPSQKGGKKEVKRRVNMKDNCCYCNKKLSKKNIYRHYKVCKKKKQQEEIKDKLIEQLLEEREQLLKDKNNDRKALTKLEETNEKLVSMAKNMSEQPNETTINQYNMFYIIKNFTDAQNIEDVMKEPLNDQEKKYILNNGALRGCSKLIKDRCITNLDLRNRPFHCLDMSRNKFLLRTNDNWDVDNKGDKILENAYPMIRPLFNIDEDVALEDRIRNTKQILDMEMNGRKKIVKELNDATYLKNSIPSINKEQDE